MRRACTKVAACAAVLFACSSDQSAVDAPADGGANAAVDASSPDVGSPTDAASDGARDAGGDTAPVDPDGPTGVFVAVGYGGHHVRSIDDGASWVDDGALVDGGGDDDTLLRTVTYGKDQFVALGWRVMTSGDGKTWQDYGAHIGQWIGGAIYANGTYVAVGGYGLRASSSDGINWVQKNIDTTASHSGALAFGNVLGGRFVSANDDGVRTVSQNGVDWTYASGALDSRTDAVAFGNGVFVGVGGDAVVVSTDGGTTWTRSATLAAPAQGLVYARDQFLTVADGRVFTSADGTTWAEHVVAALSPGSLAFGHGTYVVVRDKSSRRSHDGVTWENAVTLSASATNSFERVTFGAVP